MTKLACENTSCSEQLDGFCTDSKVLACYNRSKFPQEILPEEAEVVFQKGLEEGGSASGNTAFVENLVCICGNTLLSETSSGENMVEDDDIIECVNCYRRYQFTWEGMTIKRL